MTVTLRPLLSNQDFEGIASVLSLCGNEQVNAAELIEDEHHTPDGQIRQHWVAESASTVVGYGRVLHLPWMKTGHVMVNVYAHPDQRNKGIGRQLYEVVSAFALSNDARTFESKVLDNDPQSLQFAQARGFNIERHLFESKIDLDIFAPQPFEGIIEQVQASGIRLFALADIGNTRENLRKLWEVNYATVMDDPGTTGTFPDFDAFYNMVTAASWFNPASQFLAADGDQYVGLSAISHSPENASFYNLMTGVMPAYRGRKIAMALKLMTILYAKRHNGQTIYTDNDSQNAPMLAINRKLGYQQLPGYYRVQKI